MKENEIRERILNNVADVKEGAPIGNRNAAKDYSGRGSDVVRQPGTPGTPEWSGPRNMSAPGHSSTVGHMKGDTVKVVSPGHDAHGMTGRVTGMSKNGEFVQVRLSKESGHSGTYTFSAKELKGRFK